MKILLIEDEPKLNAFLTKGLKSNGYTVDATSSGSEGIEMASVGNHQLIILDVMLPGQNGFEVMKNLQEFKINTPVIFISALNDTEHIVKGLDLGGKDYLRKPFQLEELLARIRAITRVDDNKSYTKLILSDLMMDINSRKVFRENKEIILTNREFNLLKLLLENCNRVVSKSEISERIWEINFDMGSNVIEVHISQLRGKIDNGFERKLISTKVGMGYTVEGTLTKSN